MPKQEPALTQYEERILRMTIDDTQVFEIPVRTVKRMLALIDVLRNDERERGQPEPIAEPAPVAESGCTCSSIQPAAEGEPPVNMCPRCTRLVREAYECGKADRIVDCSTTGTIPNDKSQPDLSPAD